MNIQFFKTDAEYLKWKEENPDYLIVQVDRDDRQIKVYYELTRIAND